MAPGSACLRASCTTSVSIAVLCTAAEEPAWKSPNLVPAGLVDKRSSCEEDGTDAMPTGETVSPFYKMGNSDATLLMEDSMCNKRDMTMAMMICPKSYV